MAEKSPEGKERSIFLRKEKNKTMVDFVNLFANSWVRTIVILILVDLVLGIIAAFIKKDFVIGKVAGFMKTGFIKYVFGFVIVEIVAEALPSFAMIITVAYWLIVVALFGSILNNLGKMGLPMPKILRK